ncbi:hypothetical protein ACFQ2M_25840 [Kitasatospora saccharophila]|uniref:hypothetical protein n=1 Tax=Kitasatospora saccharophila TaxID=407973 RepID=UPI0036324371
MSDEGADRVVEVRGPRVGHGRPQRPELLDRLDGPVGPVVHVRQPAPHVRQVPVRRVGGRQVGAHRVGRGPHLGSAVGVLPVVAELLPVPLQLEHGQQAAGRGGGDRGVREGVHVGVVAAAAAPLGAPVLQRVEVGRPQERGAVGDLHPQLAEALARPAQAPRDRELHRERQRVRRVGQRDGLRGRLDGVAEDLVEHVELLAADLAGALRGAHLPGHPDQRAHAGHRGVRVPWTLGAPRLQPGVLLDGALGEPLDQAPAAVVVTGRGGEQLRRRTPVARGGRRQRGVHLGAGQHALVDDQFGPADQPVLGRDDGRPGGLLDPGDVRPGRLGGGLQCGGAPFHQPGGQFEADQQDQRDDDDQSGHRGRFSKG